MNQVFSKHKDNIIDYLVLLGFSVFTYSVLMVNRLVNNYDGIWEGSFHIADDWELSNGRWFWYYLSKLRFGIAEDPVVNIMALALFVLGIMLFVNLMEIKSRPIVYVAGTAFICAPVVCISLSYRFMSPTFGTAFVLSVLAVWLSIRIKKFWLAVLAGGLVLSLSLGSYQAYLGVSCVITLAYFMKQLLGDDSLKDCFKRILRPVVAIIIGGLLYIVLLNIHLKKNDVEMADYMGGSGYSLGTIFKYFPGSFRGIYQIFHLSMKEVLFKFNKLEKFHICLLLVIMFAALYIFYFVMRKKKEWGKAICLVAAFLLMPPAAFAVKFIAVDAPISVQMLGGFFMVVPALFCALPLSFEKNKVDKWIAGVAVIVIAAFSYGGFYQVQADQNAMFEGKQSVLALTDAIIDKTIELDYLNPDYTYCFVGSPVGSRLYWLDSATYNANTYATFGSWWDGYNSEKSWAGVIHNCKYMNMTIVTEAEYNAVISDEKVKAMPSFPTEGSIVKNGNIVVIKVSDY